MDDKELSHDYTRIMLIVDEANKRKPSEVTPEELRELFVRGISILREFSLDVKRIADAQEKIANASEIIGVNDELRYQKEHGNG